MKILLLSPYDATSHRQWREGLVRNLPDAQFEVVTLPARNFSWRLRGNSLTFSQDPRLDNPHYDLVIATSMTDLATLRGLVPRLALIPALVYFHENQFAYPVRRHDPHRVDRQLTTLYTGLAATTLLFNSEYNRRTYLEGAASLLAKMPDAVPAGIVAGLEQRSRVVPVCVEAETFRDNTAAGLRSIVWNHRWEYDKGAILLQQVLVALIESGQAFQFHLLGQPFGARDVVMQENVALLQRHHRIGRTGFIDSRDEYLALLANSHCVLSTALHEFQGLSVQEAMACGCIPVVPDRLAYPEYVDARHRYVDAEDAAAKLLAASGPVDTSRLPTWDEWRSVWDAEIARAVAY